MNKLIMISAMVVFSACSEHAARSAKAIAGTYERRLVHEFGTLQETVIITPSTAGVLQFEVREFARHLDTTSADDERRKQTEKNYHGTYDPSQRMLDLGSDGRKYYFNASADTLRSGNNIFLKRA